MWYNQERLYLNHMEGYAGFRRIASRTRDFFVNFLVPPWFHRLGTGHGVPGDGDSRLQPTAIDMGGAGDLFNS